MKNVKLFFLWVFTFCLQTTMQSQTYHSGATINSFRSTIDISCDDYLSDMYEVWDIDIPVNKHVFLEYAVNIEYEWDNVFVYSIDDSGTAVLQNTLTGWNSGSIRSLYPNGKMRIVFITDESVSCGDDGYDEYDGVYITVYANRKISYNYDAAGNRISRTILFENNTSLRTAMAEDDKENDDIYEENLEYYSEKGIQQEAKILIYPNPTQGQLAVEITNITDEAKGDILLMTQSGQLIEKKSITKDNRIEFNLSDQPSGIYLMNVQIDKTVSTWKIIKK